MLRKSLIATVAGGALSVVLASGAQAFPQFTLNPDLSSPALSSGVGPFTADAVQFTANELIQFNSSPLTSSSFDAIAVAQAINFNDAGSPVLGTGLNTFYGLFVQAHIQGTASGCVANICTWTITLADWTMVGDKGTPLAHDLLTQGSVPSTN